MRRGWVWPISLPPPADPSPRPSSRQILGSWVVFPEPVSPATMTTWWSRMAAAMSSRRAETGSSAGIGDLHNGRHSRPRRQLNSPPATTSGAGAVLVVRRGGRLDLAGHARRAAVHRHGHRSRHRHGPSVRAAASSRRGRAWSSSVTAWIAVTPRPPTITPASAEATGRRGRRLRLPSDASAACGSGRGSRVAPARPRPGAAGAAAASSEGGGVGSAELRRPRDARAGSRRGSCRRSWA